MSFTPNNLSQRDPQWKNDKLGFSNLTIGTDGCTLTCLAMLVNGFGYSETPRTLNKKLKGLGEGNGFIGPLIVWGGLPLLFPPIKYKNIILCRDQNAPVAEIDAALAKGQPVIVEVDRSLARGLQNHWVVLYEKQGDDYLMSDPWPYPSDTKEALLARRYGFGRPAKKTITAVVLYEMQGAPPAPPSGDGMYVQVAAAAYAGLRLRERATTASNTLGIEPAGTYLRVLEDEISAQAKVGVYDQWLHVRDPQGVEGYVASWYVDAVAVGAPEPEPTPEPEPEPSPEPEPQPEPDPEPQPEPTPEPEPEPDPEPPKEKLKVYVSPAVSSRGLRMRAKPSQSGRLVTTLKANTELCWRTPKRPAPRSACGTNG
ncbi:MAG: SH3 domain-containing protein [Chloroflexi bacterium]|nr:SH3 domain-containing protein [Chloroflexota bacterium]